MAILSKACTPNNFESHNPQKLIFMNIQGLCSIFVECESFLESNSSDILALLKTLVFGDFNIHHKEWLTNSSGTDRLGAPCYNFSISNDLTLIVNFPNWIPDCDSHSSVLLDLFLLLMLIFIIQWISLHWKFWSCGCVSFHWLSIKLKTGHAIHCIAYHCSHADWDSLHNYLQVVTWEDIFKLNASADATEFCEWVQVGINVYIPRRIY